MSSDRPHGVVATATAVAEVERLKGEHGPLEFFQSGGCCDGSSPMCFQAGELLLGPSDLRVGEIDGCPYYVDAELFERWGRPAFVVDIAPGAGSSMSLEGLHDVHFRVVSATAASC